MAFPSQCEHIMLIKWRRKHMVSILHYSFSFNFCSWHPLQTHAGVGGSSYGLCINVYCSRSSTAHRWTPAGEWPLIIHKFQIKSPLLKSKVITLKEVHNLIIPTERNLIHAKAWANPKEENKNYSGVHTKIMLMIHNILYRETTVCLSIIMSFWQDIFFSLNENSCTIITKKRERNLFDEGAGAV